MKYWTDIRVKIIQFLKKNRKKIILALIIFAIIFFINRYLIYLNSLNIKIELPKTTYEPHNPIMDNGDTVPENIKEPISKLIDKYFNYCNSGDYQNAYAMISEDCKKTNFPNLEDFTSYIDGIFEHKNKTYNIQNFSNKNKTYIYDVNILEDILATGTTGEENFSYYPERIVIKEENGNLKLSVASFVENMSKSIVVDDEYMTVKISNIEVNYDSEIYTVEVTNKSEYTIVLVDNYENEEVLLELDDGNMRNLRNLKQGNFVIWPGLTTTKKLKFVKYYDESRNDKSLIFNKIRIFNKYTGEKQTTQEDLDNAVKMYSKVISLE